MGAKAATKRLPRAQPSLLTAAASQRPLVLGAPTRSVSRPAPSTGASGVPRGFRIPANV